MGFLKVHKSEFKRKKKMNAFYKLGKKRISMEYHGRSKEKEICYVIIWWSVREIHAKMFK